MISGNIRYIFINERTFSTQNWKSSFRFDKSLHERFISCNVYIILYSQITCFTKYLLHKILKWDKMHPLSTTQ